MIRTGLFFHDGVIQGLVGTHVVDDIMTGNKWFEDVVPHLDHFFTYGREQRTKMLHTGYVIERWPSGAVTVIQNHYASELNHIQLHLSEANKLSEKFLSLSEVQVEQTMTEWWICLR